MKPHTKKLKPEGVDDGSGSLSAAVLFKFPSLYYTFLSGHLDYSSPATVGVSTPGGPWTDE
jgi:hypothetical protein